MGTCEDETPAHGSGDDDYKDGACYEQTCSGSSCFVNISPPPGFCGSAAIKFKVQTKSKKAGAKGKWSNAGTLTLNFAPALKVTPRTLKAQKGKKKLIEFKQGGGYTYKSGNEVNQYYISDVATGLRIYQGLPDKITSQITTSKWQTFNSSCSTTDGLCRLYVQPDSSSATGSALTFKIKLKHVDAISGPLKAVSESETITIQVTDTDGKPIAENISSDRSTSTYPSSHEAFTKNLQAGRDYYDPENDVIDRVQVEVMDGIKAVTPDGTTPSTTHTYMCSDSSSCDITVTPDLTFAGLARMKYRVGYKRPADTDPTWSDYKIFSVTLPSVSSGTQVSWGGDPSLDASCSFEQKASCTGGSSCPTGTHISYEGSLEDHVTSKPVTANNAGLIGTIHIFPTSLPRRFLH